MAALVSAALVTLDLLTRGSLERLDLWVSEIVSDWALPIPPPIRSCGW